jgi:hypothetical protein
LVRRLAPHVPERRAAQQWNGGAGAGLARVLESCIALTAVWFEVVRSKENPTLWHERKSILFSDLVFSSGTQKPRIGSAS